MNEKSGQENMAVTERWPLVDVLLYSTENRSNYLLYCILVNFRVIYSGRSLSYLANSLARHSNMKPNIAN